MGGGGCSSRSIRGYRLCGFNGLLIDAEGNVERIVGTIDGCAVLADFYAISLAVDGDGVLTLLLGSFFFAVDLVHAVHLGFAGEEEDTLLLTGCGDEDVLISERQALFFEHGLCSLHTLLGILFIDVHNLLGGRGETECISTSLHNFRVRSNGGLAEVAEYHLAITFSNLLPGSKHDIVECLLEVELGNRGNRGAEATLCYGFSHCFDDGGILVHQVVVTQHLGVCSECSTRKR
ncbi:hypothetical protein SDC9_125714 [bioreactor metagenome]|uniref:NAD-specific glutamate dehydrogenase n=1 Tax=bioreactor metagenome TaxID=1076179 RepID=A0A645CP44_9ZZZZ